MSGIKRVTVQTDRAGTVVGDLSDDDRNVRIIRKANGTLSIASFARHDPGSEVTLDAEGVALLRQVMA